MHLRKPLNVDIQGKIKIKDSQNYSQEVHNSWHHTVLHRISKSRKACKQFRYWREGGTGTSGRTGEWRKGITIYSRFKLPTSPFPHRKKNPCLPHCKFDVTETARLFLHYWSPQQTATTGSLVTINIFHPLFQEWRSKSNRAPRQD